MSEQGRRPYHHGDLRATLLVHAQDLLDRDGPEAISFRAVARAAGVSPNAPYNHFDNRRDLLAALARDGFAALTERQQQALATAGSGPERVVALGLAYLAFAAEQPQLYRLMFGTGVQNWHDIAEVAAAKAASFAPIRQVIADHLTATVGTNTSPDDPSVDIAAVASWSTVHGLAMLLVDGSLDGRRGATGTEVAAAVLTWYTGRAFG